MILIIQYFSDNLVCRRKIVSKHSDARQHWMIDSNQSNTKMNDHTSGGKIHTYIAIYITREFYNLLSRVRASKEIQWYFSIIPCDQSTKSYLPGVSTYFPFTVTNFKVAVCHFVQAKVTAISGLSFSTLSSLFLRKKYPSTVRLNK